MRSVNLFIESYWESERFWYSYFTER